VRELLDQGKLLTGKDYEHAAGIFQHGAQPDDFLLAHLLAVTAVAGTSQEAISPASERETATNRSECDPRDPRVPRPAFAGATDQRRDARPLVNRVWRLTFDP
jgi:hypothetical protein